MKRHWVSMIGLAMAVVAMLAIGRFVGAQETGNCDGCAGMMALDAKVKEWGGWFDCGKTKNGIVAVALTPSPEKGTAVLTAFKEFDALVHNKDLKMCGMCKEIDKISKTKGTTVELVPLRQGAIYMLGSKKSKTIQELHAVYDKGQAEMEKAAKAGCTDPTCSGKDHTHKDTCEEQGGKFERNESADELNLK